MRKIYRAKGAIVDNSHLTAPAFIDVSAQGLITIISQTEISDSDVKCIDLGDVLLFPGFTNAHCHLELTGLGPLTSHEFVPWIEELVARKSQSTPAKIQTAIEFGIEKLKQSGVTTIIDHISEDTPLKKEFAENLNLIGFGEILGSCSTRAELQFKSQKARAQFSSFPYYPSPHSVHAVHPVVLHTLFHERTTATPFSIHLHESQDETQYFQKHFGPIWDLKHTMHASLGVNDYHHASSALTWIRKQHLRLDHTLVIHANELTAQDIEFLKSQKNICIVHCPGSHEFFDHAPFSFKKLQAAGLPIALGTDSLASNTELNYLHELNLFTSVYKNLNFWTILPMLTTNALLPLGIKDRGQISIGFYADIAVFEWDGTSEPLAVLLGAKHVKSLIRAGQIEKLTHA